MEVVCRIHPHHLVGQPLHEPLSESGIGSTTQVEQSTNYHRRPAVPVISLPLVSDELLSRWGDGSVQVDVVLKYPLRDDAQG